MILSQTTSTLLFEPFLWNDISDMPDLGIAMLSGACKKQNIEVKVVASQSLFIKHVFLYDIHELFEYVSNMEDIPTYLKKYFIIIQKLIQQGDIQYVQNHLRMIYSRILSRKWIDFLDSELVEYATSLLQAITELYKYLLLEKIILIYLF